MALRGDAGAGVAGRAATFRDAHPEYARGIWLGNGPWCLSLNWYACPTGQTVGTNSERHPVSEQ